MKERSQKWNKLFWLCRERPSCPYSVTHWLRVLLVYSTERSNTFLLLYRLIYQLGSYISMSIISPSLYFFTVSLF